MIPKCTQGFGGNTVRVVYLDGGWDKIIRSDSAPKILSIDLGMGEPDVTRNPGAASTITVRQCLGQVSGMIEA